MCERAGCLPLSYLQLVRLMARGLEWRNGRNQAEWEKGQTLGCEAPNISIMQFIFSKSHLKTRMTDMW